MTLSTPKPLVKREIRFYATANGNFGALPSETNGLKKQIKDILDEASNANVGSETNETPVESVSQPKAVDGYLKEFDERYKLSLVRSLQQHIYKKPANYHDRKHNEVIGQLVYKVERLNLLPEMKSLWESSIERARREGVEAGRKEMDKEWSKVNKYERQRVVEMIERMYPYEEIEKFKGMDYIEIVQEVKSDLQSKLKEDK